MVHDLFEKLVGQAIYMYVWFVKGGTASVIVSPVIWKFGG